MHGNVEEWCWDWYGDYSNLYQTQTNPTGAVTGTYRVKRGGTYTASGWCVPEFCAKKTSGFFC